MKFLAAVISTFSLAGFSWADCSMLNPSNPAANREAALENLRHTGFTHYREGQYQNAAACYTEALHTAQALGISNTATATDLNNLAVLAEEMGNYTEARNYYLRELDVLNRMGDAGAITAGETYAELEGCSRSKGPFRKQRPASRKQSASSFSTPELRIPKLRTC